MYEALACPTSLISLPPILKSAMASFFMQIDTAATSDSCFDPPC